MFDVKKTEKESEKDREKRRKGGRRRKNETVREKG